MRARLRWAFALLAIAGCGDDGSAEDVGATETEGATTSSPMTGMTGMTLGDTGGTTTEDPDTTADSTAGDATEGTGDTGETDATDTGAVGPCSVLCGGVCCDDDESCAQGECVDACDTGIRCGADLSTCCNAGEVCIEDVCAPADVPCVDSFDCGDGAWCDPLLSACLGPDPDACVYEPQGALELVLEWSVESDEFITMPVVGDVDDDGLPEVVLSSWAATDPGGASANFFGEIIVLAGADGTEQFRIENNPMAGTFGSYGRSSLGLGDVNGDEIPDIVYVGRPQVGISPFPNNASLIHAVDGQGTLLWTSRAPDDSPYFIYVRHGAPAFANLDDDDQAEIAYGSTVIDHDGVVVYDQDNSLNFGGGVFGSNGNYLGGIATFADLDGDDEPELVTGRDAWSVSWTDLVGSPTVALFSWWSSPQPDGFPAVADLDDDGDPEVVVVGDPAPFDVADGTVYVLDGASGELWCGVDSTDAQCAASPALRTQPALIPGGGRGGPPAVADFDGDGRLEIAVAGAGTVSVFDLNREDEEVVQPGGDAFPPDGAIFRRWSTAVMDAGSSSTTVSAYDFDGDGAAEVLFNDECYLRILSGADGAVLVEIENSTPTFHESPLVADVDADGEAELVVVASDNGAATACGTIPGYTARRGVFVYGTGAEPWTRTRRTWNMHPYVGTAATANGLVPATYVAHWQTERSRGFRRGPSDPLVVPDLGVDLVGDQTGCDDGELMLRVIVRNMGSATLPAGISVELYAGAPGVGRLITMLATSMSLPPGHEETLDWTVDAPSEPAAYHAIVGGSAVYECSDANNVSVLAGVQCP